MSGDAMEQHEGTAPDPIDKRAATALVAIITMSTVPYLALKLAWLLGSDLGVKEAGLMDSAVMRWANAATFVMDVCVIGLAIALVYRPQKFRRLIVVAMWSATGLLVPAVLTAAVSVITDRAADARDPSNDLHGWVYALVYAGFACQGLFLSMAFTRSLPRLWPATWGTNPKLDSDDRSASRSRRPAPRRRRLYTTAQVVAMFATLAAGAASVLAARQGDQTPTQTATWCIQAAAAAAACWGLVNLRLHAAPSRLTHLLLWTGSSCLVLWGGYGRLVASHAGAPTRFDLLALDAQVVAGLALLLIYGRSSLIGDQRSGGVRQVLRRSIDAGATR